VDNEGLLVPIYVVAGGLSMMTRSMASEVRSGAWWNGFVVNDVCKGNVRGVETLRRPTTCQYGLSANTTSRVGDP
jgi:hypothetical protein